MAIAIVPGSEKERRAILMHDATLWAGGYFVLLAVPVVLIGSVIREKLAHRRSLRQRR